jgi:hypothetical protein
MSIGNIQGSGSLVPFDEKGSHTLELRKEAQATHELSMQVFQEMQGVITRLQEQNTCLKVALIKANGRESTTEIVHHSIVNFLELDFKK